MRSPLPSEPRRVRSGFGLFLLRAVALALALVLPALPVRAERADSNQPLLFDAGQLRIDGKRRIQWLSGGVELTQGSLRIQAAEVELRDTPAGRLALAEGGGDALVTFRQKRDGVDEWIEGQARRVEYDGATQVVRFIQKAQLRLLRNGVVADQISGEQIVYDHNRDLFEVQAGAPGSAAGTRVRGSVAPRPAPAPAPLAAPPAASAATPQLPPPPPPPPPPPAPAGALR